MTSVQSASSPDDALDSAVLAAVESLGGAGATLDQIWAAAHSVEPELAWAVDRRQRLDDSLRRLEAAGLIACSRTNRALDHSGLPALPRRARPARAPAAPIRPPRPTVPRTWRPELAAAQTLERPRPDEIEVLNAINDWLRDRKADEPVRPLRERSWQIFGNEKRLDSVVRQRLFRDGILTLDLIRAEIVHPPFVYTRVAATGRAFVCENHQTYHSAAQVLLRSNRDFAVVGYGAGRQFQASVSYCQDLGVEREIVYFGDLDADGLAIAQGAALEAAALELPPVVPATHLYELLLQSERRSKAKRIAPTVARDLIQWLHPSQHDRVAELLVDGHRIPQEAVGAPELCAQSDW